MTRKITLLFLPGLDILPLAVTFFTCLFLGLEYGILFGIATNLLFILYNTSRPRLHCDCVAVEGHSPPPVILVTPDQNLYFSAAEYVRYKVLQVVSTHSEASLVVLNGQHVNHMDATMATNLKSLLDDCNLLNKRVLFWNWQPQPMGVAIRLTAEFKPLFKCASTLENLVQLDEAERQCNGVSIVPPPPSSTSS